MKYRGFWFAWDVSTRANYFIIVNSNNQGRIYDDIILEFSEKIHFFDQNGNFGNLSLRIRRRGEEHYVGVTKIAWPTLKEKDRLFIES